MLESFFSAAKRLIYLIILNPIRRLTGPLTFSILSQMRPELIHVILFQRLFLMKFVPISLDCCQVILIANPKSICWLEGRLE